MDEEQAVFEQLTLTLFFPMFPFDSHENIRKPKGFLMFSGGSKGNIGKKKVKMWSSTALKISNSYSIIMTNNRGKNEPSKNCGRQPLKNLKGYGLLKDIVSL